ncbi:hypothetical protein VTO73DRAFT_2852 [Trametes versicolor]
MGRLQRRGSPWIERPRLCILTVAVVAVVLSIVFIVANSVQSTYPSSRPPVPSLLPVPPKHSSTSRPLSHKP